MSSIHKWATPNSVETILTTELNSLALNAQVVSSAIDNAAGLYKFADIELYASGAISAGNYCPLYILESLDGTNFESDTGGTGDLTDNAEAQFVGSFIVNSASKRRRVLRGIRLPPTKFKLVIVGGYEPMDSSDNTLRLTRYNEADV